MCGGGAAGRATVKGYTVHTSYGSQQLPVIQCGFEGMVIKVYLLYLIKSGETSKLFLRHHRDGSGSGGRR